MASRSKKALREIASIIPTKMIVEEFFLRLHDGLIDIPEKQSSEVDRDGLVTLIVNVKDDV